MSRKHDMMIENNETYPKRTGKASKSFFVILMLCLIAVGGVAATTFSSSLSDTPAFEETTVTTVVTTTSVAPVVVTPAATTTITTASTVATTTTAPATLYVLPLSNKVLTSFSTQPIYNETLDSYSAHTATDFDGEEGQLVHPFADGIVTAAEDDPLWGGCVTVDHGEGIVSIYRGIAPTVDIGDEITTADSLGTLDAVPCESKLGPHLHLELYKDGKTADVAALFADQLIIA